MGHKYPKGGGLPKEKRSRAYDEVPELWPNCTAILMATGPSLTEAQVKYVEAFHREGHVKVFGCNDVYRICTYLDVLYACDPHWWDKNSVAVDHPCGQKWTQDARAAEKYSLKCVRGSSGQGLNYAKNQIYFGSNSGFQLLNLAWHFGARRFILLGYNMDVPKGMQQHFFGPHPDGLNQTNNYKSFVGSYKAINDETKRLITNCTYPTALGCFDQKPLEEALPNTLLKNKVHYETDQPAEYTFLGSPIERKPFERPA